MLSLVEIETELNAIDAFDALFTKADVRYSTEWVGIAARRMRKRELKRLANSIGGPGSLVSELTSRVRIFEELGHRYPNNESLQRTLKDAHSQLAIAKALPSGKQ